MSSFITPFYTNAKSSKYDYIRNLLAQKPELIFNFLNIYDHEKKKVSPCKPYPYQVKRLLKYFDCLKNGRDSIDLKGRQIGATELFVWFVAEIMAIMNNQRVLITSIGEKESKKVIRRIVDLFNHSHPILKYLLKDFSPTTFNIECNKNYIESATTTTKTGTSDTYAFVFADELAKVEVDIETFIASLQSTLSHSGGPLFANSTAFGLNYFHHLWNECVAGKKNMLPTFLSWRVVPGRTHEWYEMKRLEYPNDNLFKQEHPSTPDEAFIASGIPIFDNEILSEMKLQCEKPKFVGSITDDFVRYDSGPMSIWQDAIPEETYYLTIDGSEGRGQDYSVLYVIKARDNADVLRVRSNRMDINVLAKWAAHIGRRYNNAKIICERNSVGFAIINALYNYEGYSNLYRTRNVASSSKSSLNSFGYHTGDKTKEALISVHSDAIRNRNIIFNDEVAVDEHMGYYSVEGKMQAAHGLNDDTVISRALGSFLIKEYPILNKRDLINLNYETTYVNRDPYKKEGTYGY